MTATATRHRLTTTPRRANDAAEPVPVAATPLHAAVIRADGPFSVVEQGTLSIEAEDGLVIRVNAGCVWVPHHAEPGSVGVGPGEQLVVRQTGTLHLMAMAHTQVALERPVRG